MIHGLIVINLPLPIFALFRGESVCVCVVFYTGTLKGVVENACHLLRFDYFDNIENTTSVTFLCHTRKY